MLAVEARRPARPDVLRTSMARLARWFPTARSDLLIRFQIVLIEAFLSCVHGEPLSHRPLNPENSASGRYVCRPSRAFRCNRRSVLGRNPLKGPKLLFSKPITRKDSQSEAIDEKGLCFNKWLAQSDLASLTETTAMPYGDSQIGESSPKW
jgi:hypothetical protein